MKKQVKSSSSEFNRRDFLRGSSVATIMAMMGGIPIRAQEKKEEPAAAEPKKGSGPPINCGLIGCGVQGREILKNLALLPNAPVVAVCDTYPAFLRRAKEAAPKAEGYQDYKQLLANKEVKAVFIATPTHLHKEITLETLAAGKHVYCEAPLAHTIEDARIIAKAAKAAEKVNFQAGLQMRSEPQRLFMLPFMRSGSAGKYIKARAQWHKKTSWRRTSPNPDREKELNWRLSRTTSAGLIGEIGIHQVDVASWFFGAHPKAVIGFGKVLQWADDGRDVPDTVEAIFEYPNGALLNWEATLGNSFDADYEVFYGTDSAILLRGSNAWMFKEVDAPMLGWEVYAKKEQFYKETGIVLNADSSKQKALGGGTPGAEAAAAAVKEPISSALEAFITNSNTLIAGVEDFVATYGENAKGLKEYLAGLAKEKSRIPAAGYQEGFEAVVTALKANEAILSKEKITFQKEWFEI